MDIFKNLSIKLKHTGRAIPFLVELYSCRGRNPVALRFIPQNKNGWGFHPLGDQVNLYVPSQEDICMYTICPQFQGFKGQKPILNLFGGEGSGVESKTLCIIAFKKKTTLKCLL